MLLEALEALPPLIRAILTLTSVIITVFFSGALYFNVRETAKHHAEKAKLEKQLQKLRFEQSRDHAQVIAQASQSAVDEVVEPSGVESLDVPAIPDQLLKACADKTGILFVGAGLGIDVGYPTRSQLLSRMLDALKNETEAGPEWEELRQLVVKREFSIVEEVLEARLGREHVLTLALDASHGDDDSQVPEALAAFSTIEFSGVASTTWDDLVDRAFIQRRPKKLYSKGTSDYARILRSGDFFSLKPYGDQHDRSTLIFLSDEYEQVIYENRDYARFVGSLFSAQTILFVGASLDTIEQFIENSEIRSKSDRGHFALVPKDASTSLQQERLYKKYKLTLLPFNPTPGYPEVTQFAKTLRDAVGQTATDKERPMVDTEILRSLKLENIGPFEDLDIDFNDNWNVLLGDNGCGKSTILRAIALALAGDDRTGQAANALLRSNEQSGSISLRLGRDATYEVELIRDGKRVKVIPTSITPVQSGKWLVLGFPAMRGVSKQKLKGIESVKDPNPNVDDLLPLLDEMVDTRFDSLRQWLVNLAVESKGQDGKAEASRKLRDEFFATMQHLSPSVDFSYAGYTDDPYDILVNTRDGEIRIGAISQGMSSVFAWVGTLLQRLEEIYRDADKSESQQCLVLIDEIDAHLHPEWQSEIMGLLRKNFRNLQVIATTHSPLIVANAEKGEVFYLKREAKAVSIKRINYSFKGWRADQILTAEGFGMTAARDSETKEKIGTYRTLVTQDELSSKDQATLDSISRDLDELPSYHELAETREAAKLMSDWMSKQIQDLPEAKKQEVLREAKVYLAKIRSGE